MALGVEGGREGDDGDQARFKMNIMHLRWDVK